VNGSGVDFEIKCKLGLSLEKDKSVIDCKCGNPSRGFQIGGYFTHMWFSVDGTLPEDGGQDNPCLNWHIASDGEFPTENKEPGITFHICDFMQIELFVKFWGKELRRRGWITE